MNGWETARNIADWLEGQLQAKAHEQIDRLEKQYNEPVSEQFDIRTESNHYRMVKRFMRGAKQETPDKPTIPDEETRLLRAKLILEEALETIDALGVDALIDQGIGENRVVIDDFVFDASRLYPNLQEIIDGCCDLKVVTTGTLIACGVPDGYVQIMVDENNLDKIERGTVREDGKLIKPPDHKPPNVKGFLEDLGYEQ